MITKCIVSAFTHVRWVAVLFESRFCNCFAKGLLLVSILLIPFSSKAEMTGKNWYGADGAVIESQNSCNSVYRITLTPQNDGQLQLFKDGKDVNSTNTVFASDIPSSISWQTGSSGDNAVKFSNPDNNEFVLYFIEGSEKDTLAFSKPGYDLLGVGGVGYEFMNLTTEPTFTPTYCSNSSAEIPTTATFQWQVYNKKTAAWEDIDGATNKDYSPAAGSLDDSTKIRVVMTNGTNKMVSSSVLAFYNSPGLGVKLTGTELFETIQKPTYEHEIDYGKPFVVDVIALGASTLSSITLKTRSDNDEAFTDYMSITTPESSFTITPSQNLEYLVEGTAIDMRPGHEGEELTVKDTFFVRVRFSWDEGADVDTLFFDNFGVFTADNEYTTSNNLKFTDELTDTVGVKNKIVNYWAPDYYNSVKNHEFSLLNPLVGPFDTDDCAADGYKHYACWSDNGTCDGYRIEDGYYAVVPNPDYSNCGQSKKDYWNGYDHTEESTGVLGGMLFVNCAADSKETILIEREITLSNECENTRLLFSAYVNNATAVASNKPVNVRLKVLDQNDHVIYETPSGNIYPRTVKGGMWANLSFMFNAVQGGKYKLQLVNNQPGGAQNFGNDLLFDDILIIAAYPTVNVFRDRMKSSMVPIDTCEEVSVPLFVLNKDDIKKYITTPSYLYQYSKDSVNWVNIGEITDVDSFMVTLNKQTPLFWDTTYFRGIVASNEEVINRILDGKAPVLSCDSVYAVSDPFRVVFDYGGPLDPTYRDTLCIGEKFEVTVSAHNRPVYRWVNSRTLETINNQDSTFSYVITENDPVDTLFYFVTETRLGCKDTMEVYVHRRSFVEFNTPDSLVVCLFDQPVSLSDVVPANATFEWKSGTELNENTTTPSVMLPQTLPHQGVITVTGSDKDYCSTTKSFPYSIHTPIEVTLSAERTDSMFCLESPEALFKLTANTVQGVPVLYYWTKNDIQVGFTKAPVNYYSFGSLTEGETVFGVHVVDEVCNKTSESEFKAGIPTKLREPITIEMATIDRLCENETVSAEVTLNHLLDPNTATIYWAVPSNNGTLANETNHVDANFKATNVVTPAPLTNTTEQIVLAASTVDAVCPNNVPTVSSVIDLYKQLDITVTTDRSDSLFCMSNTGITFTATTNRGYAKDFFWYADGVMVEKTGHDVYTYTFPVETEGKHVYGVNAVDGVCNVRDSNEFAFSVPVETRQPITISLTTDENICENAVANAELTFEHLLAPDNTNVFWAVSSGNGTLASESTTTSGSKSTNVVTPDPLTNTTEQIYLAASVVDEVCTDNKPVANTVIGLYKKLDVTVTTDRDDHLFCMGSSEGITFNAVTNRGYVDKFNWYADSVLVATTDHDTPSFTFPVTVEGKHYFGVKMVDGVCSTDAAQYEFEYPAETRLPITFTLKADTSFCESNGLAVVANFEHLLQNPTEVLWSVSENGKLYTEKSYTDGDSTVNSITAIPTSNYAEKVAVFAAVADLVCPANSPVNQSLLATIHKNVIISLAADNNINQKCLINSTDAEVGLNITVERGNPAYYIWSDGVKDTKLSRSYTLALGDNIISVDAYDSVCVENKAAATANTYVTTRVPLHVNLGLTKGTNPICVGNEIEVTAYVDNNFPGDEIIYTWNPAVGSGSSIVYRPKSGFNVIQMGAIAANAICPVQVAEYGLSVQDSVKIGIDATPYLCQTQDSANFVQMNVIVYAGNPQMFVWSTGDTTIDNVNYHNPTKNTVYGVYAIDKVCANSFTVYTPEVQVSNLYTIDVTPETDKVQMGEEVKFNVNIPEGYTNINLAWYMINQFNDTLYLGNSTEAGFSYPMPQNGEYTFFSTADDGFCGILSSSTIFIDVADYYQVPNAFTPYNGNPKNDVFMKGYPVKIFNRYQQMVYEGPDGWDGQYNGQLAEPGTYFYVLVKKDGRTLKGTIELVKFK
ncbi:MAG: gliding motility-associated C-terminal domain-containing protein [Paludibacteraceae bacterium]|nr:gliding motility-associated C-terminal domain-containing protein [Paludibacteraceae bacterium]